MTIANEEIKSAVAEIEAKLSEAVKKYEGEVFSYGEATKSARDEVKAIAAAHEALVKQFPELVDRIKSVEVGMSKPLGGGEATKSWGVAFSESDELKSFREGGSSRARIEVKNTILGETGSPAGPSNTLVSRDRLPGIVPGAFRSLNVLDFVPSGSTSGNAIEYPRELLWSNAAAPVNEGAQKPESTLTFELVTDPVRTIAHWIKASKQILDDAPMLASYIDRRMEYGVRSKLQTQIIAGTGVAPNISGLSATGRYTAFTPASGDTALDSLNKAKYAVVGADYDANVIFMNPVDFGAIERLKTSTTSYLGGDGGSLSYINSGMTPIIWGLPVVMSNDVPVGKFFMADTAAFMLFMRSGVVVEMFEQDDTNVQKNLLTIRAECRAALAVFTPLAVRYGNLKV